VSACESVLVIKKNKAHAVKGNLGIETASNSENGSLIAIVSFKQLERAAAQLERLLLLRT